MENNDDGTDEASGTPQSSQYAQFLVQEIRAQDSTDQYGQRPEWRYQDGRCEGVCCEVTDLANYDYAHNVSA